MVPRCVHHFHLARLTDCHLEGLLMRCLGADEGAKLVEELKKAEETKLCTLVKEIPLLANMVVVLIKKGP